jgi:hypothetical protein
MTSIIDMIHVLRNEIIPDGIPQEEWADHLHWRCSDETREKIRHVIAMVRDSDERKINQERVKENK